MTSQSWKMLGICTKLCSTKESRKNILLRWLTFDNLTLKFCSQPEPGHQAWKCWTFTIKWRGPAVKRRRIRVNILGLWRFSFLYQTKDIFQICTAFELKFESAWKCWIFTLKWRRPPVKRRRVGVNILWLWSFNLL